ncbi:MAG TPA: hypothetical protein VHW46_08430 [Terracidiphilus sp.]|jgi:hypothetical protein|nr:hypothetical protein [Terracidiphilus sp.]
MAYLVDRDGRMLGPYSKDEIPHRVEAAEIALSDLACDEYHGRWMPLSELISDDLAEVKTIPNTLGHPRSMFSAIGWSGGLAILYFFYRVARFMHTWVKLHPH